ncbi:glycosyltransferase [Phyllobacterium sp. 0TCS1.6C]|uniref:glycosyltransferase n=1 Tax=unclassified Phyllobacterium TaxID=2638441 RepID=UPI0022653A7C|nr:MULTISPECIES: glycosyltransferase [unclassified Phyllobacterium]MCX8280773.1 glycosyltransferase [Phyllobacterium sp. 0TCS1.6C]MCX8292650.1 glycosyltransferase [Phyllobacterium sp. 0TCS1.6A]
MVKVKANKAAFEMPDAEPVHEWSGLRDRDTPSVWIATPDRNFGCAGRSRIINEIFDDGPHTQVVWQPDIYHEAAKVFNLRKHARVIDLGCGNAMKLKSCFENIAAEVVAVDFKASLGSAKANFPEATLVDCDLTDWDETRRTAANLSGSQPATIICSDVIEHLPDPRPLLALARSLLAGNPESRIFFSTPDRHRLAYEVRDDYPSNRSHVREWTLAELCDLLAACGFENIRAGHIRPNKFDSSLSTSFVECGFNRGKYGEFLSRIGIPAGLATKTLLVTTEFPGLNKAGGIGTVVVNQHKLNPHSAVLLADTHINESNGSVLTLNALLAQESLESRPIEDNVLKFVEQLLFFLPDLETVEYQDYGGIGFRVAQAKHSGMFPGSLKTVVHCHGNLFYVENASEHWFDIDLQPIAEKEKVAIERSDEVVFPTNFLRTLYEYNGMAMRDEAISIVPYPYDGALVGAVEYETIDTIVFVGKRTRMKGFDLFCDAFTPEVCQSLRKRGVTRIVLIGPRIDPEDPFDRSEIGAHFDVEEYADFGHEQLLAFIRGNRSHCLFVQPCRADNFPLAVYDVVSSGGTLIAASAGGIPEIFQAKEWDKCLFNTTPTALSSRMLEALDWSANDRARLNASLIGNLRSNNEVARSFIRKDHGSKEKSKDLSVTVLIPFYNTFLGYVEELFWALNEQSHTPNEVIIVDDASESSNVEALKELAGNALRVPFRIVSHQTNLGLAGARNTGLAECKTDVLINIDSDDIPLTNWVKNIVRAFARDDKTVVAVPYLQAFEDGDTFNSWGEGAGIYVYRPIGEGYVISQTDNHLGHANGGVRVDSAKQLGGWDQSSKAKWEDWTFYLRVIASGGRIAVIPRVDCLYRVRPNSMVRTYGDWPGYKRVAAASDVLPRFESIQLQRQLWLQAEKARRLSAMEHERALLLHDKALLEHDRALVVQDRDQIALQLQALRSRKVVRLVDAASRRMSRYPRLHHATARLISFAWRFGGRLRAWRK